jgi:hypothetical protein
MGRQVDTEDDYKSSLLKLVPTEFVAVHLLALPVPAAIAPANPALAMVLLDAVILLVIPFWLRRISGIGNWRQVSVTMISFVVWVYSVPDGPFQLLDLYKDVVASFLLGFWTALVAPLILGKRPI